MTAPPEPPRPPPPPPAPGGAPPPPPSPPQPPAPPQYQQAPPQYQQQPPQYQQQPPQYQQQPPQYQQNPQYQQPPQPPKYEYSYQQHQPPQYQQPPVPVGQYQQPPQPPGVPQPPLPPQAYGGPPPVPGYPPKGQGHGMPQGGVVQSRAMPGQGQWSSGLCDCFEDLPSCVITCFVPCVSHGMVYGRADGGKPWFLQCCLFILAAELCYAHLWLLGTMRRSKLRTKYGLPEDPCADCCVGCCCTPCALCQEWRELDRRGVPAAGGPF